MAKDGQCLYHHVNLVNALVYVGYPALKKSFLRVLCINQHNYYPIKRSMELQLHDLSDSFLLNFGHRFENLPTRKVWGKIFEKKYGSGFGIFDDWGLVLFGWFGWWEWLPEIQSWNVAFINRCVWVVCVWRSSGYYEA